MLFVTQHGSHFGFGIKVTIQKKPLSSAFSSDHCYAIQGVVTFESVDEILQSVTIQMKDFQTQMEISGKVSKFYFIRNFFFSLVLLPPRISHLLSQHSIQTQLHHQQQQQASLLQAVVHPLLRMLPCSLL